MTREESTRKIERGLSELIRVSSELAKDMRYSLCEQEPPLKARDRELELDPVVVIASVKYKIDCVVKHVEVFVDYVRRHTKT